VARRDEAQHEGMRARLLLSALALLTGLASDGLAQSQPKSMAPDIPLPILQSLPYVDIESGRSLPLIDGVYADRKRSLRLEPSLVAQGDLDNDGTRDAAVLLEERINDVPTLHLAAVVQRAGRIRNMASLRLGEHVQIRSLAIEDKTIVLALLVMGEGDAKARPTLKMTLGLKLAGSELQIMRQEPGGRFTIAELAGTSWKLANSPHVITAQFAAAPDGGLRLTGRAPCNHYAATLDAGGKPRTIVKGPPLGTKRDCATEAATAESDFLAALGATRSIDFKFGKLALAAGESALLLE